MFNIGELPQDSRFSWVDGTYTSLFQHLIMVCLLITHQGFTCQGLFIEGLEVSLNNLLLFTTGGGGSSPPQITPKIRVSG